MVDKQRSIHDRHTNTIAYKPGIIGLDGIVLSTAEAHMFNKKGGLYHEPDGLAFDPSTRTLYNIEYKCGTSGYNKAVVQLLETSKELRKMFPNYDVVNLYVHENYKVERI